MPLRAADAPCWLALTAHDASDDFCPSRFSSIWATKGKTYHHKAEEYMDTYLEAASNAGKKTLLFRSFDQRRQMTERRLHPSEVWGMIQR